VEKESERPEPARDGGGQRRVAAVAIGLLAAATYLATAAAVYSVRAPKQAYFDELAEAFLAGRLDLAAPRDTHDLVRHEGRWYVPFPPAPAVLLMPWVACFGAAGTNTVFYSMLVGSLNVAVVFLFLEALRLRGLSRLRARDDLWLTLLFALGTVHWSIAPLGEVWYSAQLTTVLFLALAAWLAATGRSPWLVGGALAVAVGTRPHVVLCWPFLAGLAAEPPPGERRKTDGRRWAGWATRSLVPPFVAVCALLGYNHARFGSPFDFGYSREAVAVELAADLATYGQFSLHYAARNLRIILAGLPRWVAAGHRWEPDPLGMSLFLTTPALVWCARAGLRSWWTAGAWIGTLLVLLPLVFYYNTGWWQFGYRFSLDFVVPAMALLAAGAGRRASLALRIAIVAGIAVNGWGVSWWGETWYPRLRAASAPARTALGIPADPKVEDATAQETPPWAR
jgi:hypothetical protein